MLLEVLSLLPTFGMFRMHIRAASAFLLAIALSLAVPARADQDQSQAPAAEPLPSIIDKTKGMTRRDGFIPLDLPPGSGGFANEP